MGRKVMHIELSPLPRHRSAGGTVSPYMDRYRFPPPSRSRQGGLPDTSNNLEPANYDFKWSNSAC
jgi:hypothetical protein